MAVDKTQACISSHISYRNSNLLPSIHLYFDVSHHDSLLYEAGWEAGMTFAHDIYPIGWEAVREEGERWLCAMY